MKTKFADQAGVVIREAGVSFLDSYRWHPTIMYYLAVALDYDATLATNGRVARSTIQALKDLHKSGRRLILVTGRQLDDLQTVFESSSLFDRVVAENGAILYEPASKRQRMLCEAPPKALIDALREHKVRPLAVGKAIIATHIPNEGLVLDLIRHLGLEMQVIFNKGAVMVLPPGVNKRSGLCASLEELNLSPHNVVGIGDAENDHAFLAECECSVAVANALSTVKERADLITDSPNGQGVEEFIKRLLEDDLVGVAKLERAAIPLGPVIDAKTGHIREQEMFRIQAYGSSIMVAGPSQTGKSSIINGLVERIAEKKYQFCLIDPEGDYDEFEQAVCLGEPSHAPGLDEMLQVLAHPEQNLTVNLLGVKLADRPMFFASLLLHLVEMRVRTGRPHWIIVEEAHHLLPASWIPAPTSLPMSLYGMVFITTQPKLLAAAALASVDVVIATGAQPEKIFAAFAETRKIAAPKSEASKKRGQKSGEALAWYKGDDSTSIVRAIPAKADFRRHVRKYAEGKLPPDRSFYFRGPQNKLNLRAYNLLLFTELAEGIDDETWMYHLRQSDYSSWFREDIKDKRLSAEAAKIEKGGASADSTRKQIISLIRERYTTAA